MPATRPKEHPKLLRQMISFHMKKLGYSASEMAKLLHLRPLNSRKCTALK